MSEITFDPQAELSPIQQYALALRHLHPSAPLHAYVTSGDGDDLLVFIEQVDTGEFHLTSLPAASALFPQLSEPMPADAAWALVLETPKATGSAPSLLERCYSAASHAFRNRVGGWRKRDILDAQLFDWLMGELREKANDPAFSTRQSLPRLARKALLERRRLRKSLAVPGSQRGRRLKAR